MAVQGIPRLAGTMTITIAVSDAARAAGFYAQAFGGEEIARCVVDRRPPRVGPVKGVTMRIGEAVVEISTANPRTWQTMAKWGAKTPAMLGGFSTFITLHVDDVDGAAARAVQAGARQHGPLETTPTGERVAILEDPFGHPWALATLGAEVAADESNRRWLACAGPDAPRLEVKG